MTREDSGEIEDSKKLSFILRISGTLLISCFPLYLSEIGLSSESARLLGLISVISILVYVFGLEMHVINSRDIANGKSPYRALKFLLKLELVIFLSFCPILIAFSQLSPISNLTIPISLAAFASLCFQETYRVLLVSRKNMLASLLYFFRALFPVILTLLNIHYQISPLSAEYLFIYTFVGSSTLGAVLGIHMLKRNKVNSPVDFIPEQTKFSIIHLIRNGASFFPHTLLLRILFQYEVLWATLVNNEKLTIWSGYQIAFFTSIVLLQELATIQPNLHWLLRKQIPFRRSEFLTYFWSNLFWCAILVIVQICTTFYLNQILFFKISNSYLILMIFSSVLLLLYNAIFPILLGMDLQKSNLQTAIVSIVVLLFASFLLESFMGAMVLKVFIIGSLYVATLKTFTRFKSD